MADHVQQYCEYCGQERPQDTYGRGTCEICGHRMRFVSWNNGEEAEAKHLLDVLRARGTAK